MRIISFDVGIKNMAYCIFELKEDSPLSILDWNILNLMDEDKKEIPKCNCILEKKTKKKKDKVENIPCEKTAKYKKGEKYFCEKHAKNSVFRIPTKECSLTYIKKLPIQELKNICHENFFFETDQKIPILKNEFVEFVYNSLQKRCLEPIVQEKKKTANETDLITIGRNMNVLLNKNPYLENITHVLIENQISPIANRMKTIQGMLCQYFIMKGSSHIEFISSANKLKGFVLEKKIENKFIEKKDEIVEKESKESKDKKKYKEHKKDGITICSQFLEKNPQISQWKSCLLSIKKDDYADSFLQGIWYLKHNNLIKYNEEFIIM